MNWDHENNKFGLINHLFLKSSTQFLKPFLSGAGQLVTACSSTNCRTCSKSLKLILILSRYCISRSCSPAILANIVLIVLIVIKLKVDQTGSSFNLKYCNYGFFEIIIDLKNWVLIITHHYISNFQF